MSGVSNGLPRKTSSLVLPLRPLGRTGIDVSAIGFGAAPLGDLYAHLDDGEAIQAVVAAARGGILLFDTSPLYGHGLSEHRVGTAIRRVGRESVVLSTKVGRVMSPARGPWDREGYAGGLPFAAAFDYSYDGALRSLEQSLLRLGTDRIDILLVHDIDRRNHGDALPERVAEVMAGAWRALERLKAEGVVRAVGIGVNEAEVCAHFAERCDLDVVLLAGRYSLLEQGPLDTFLPLAKARGIGVMLGGVFNSGILATGPVAGAKYDYAEAPPDVLERTRRIEAVCRRCGIALPVAALRFAALHPAVSTLLLGATTTAEVDRNLAAFRTPVPARLWDDLKAEGLIRADAPTTDNSL